MKYTVFAPGISALLEGIAVFRVKPPGAIATCNQMHALDRFARSQACVRYSPRISTIGSISIFSAMTFTITMMGMPSSSPHQTQKNNYPHHPGRHNSADQRGNREGKANHQKRHRQRFELYECGDAATKH